jgi:hypothetical protein
MLGCFSHATLGYMVLAANAFGMFTDSLLLLDKLSADSYCYLISPLFVKEVGSITKKIEDERDSEKLEFLSTFTNIMPL